TAAAAIAPAAAAFTAAIAPAAATTTTATFTARGTIAGLFARTGDIDGELTSLKILAVEHLDSFIGFFGRGQFNESKPAGFAGEFVQHQVDGGDDTGLGK